MTDFLQNLDQKLNQIQNYQCQDKFAMQKTIMKAKNQNEQNIFSEINQYIKKRKNENLYEDDQDELYNLQEEMKKGDNKSIALINNYQNKFKRRCKQILIPQKLIAPRKIHVLGSNQIIDENLIWGNSKSVFDQHYTQEMEKDIEKSMANMLNHYKYIDYVSHENPSNYKNSQNNNKVEFICQNFMDYSNVNYFPEQYLIERFLSFGNSEFKEYADQIKQVQQKQNDFLQNVLPNLQKQENVLLQQQGGYINRTIKKVNELFSEFKDYPVEIIHFKFGYKGKQMDNVCNYQNKKFINLLGYEIEEVIDLDMKTLKQHQQFVVRNYEKFQIMQKKKTSESDLKLDFKMLVDFPDDLFQLKQKNGNLINVKGKLLVNRDLLDFYKVFIVTEVY